MNRRLGSHALYQLDQRPIPRIAARRVARFQIFQAETVLAALVGIEQPGRMIAGMRLGQQMPQSPREDGNRTAASVLKDQEVEIRMSNDRLETQQAHFRIPQKLLPRRPLAAAGPAGGEGSALGLGRHASRL